jgi:hypothetical protein
MLEDFSSLLGMANAAGSKKPLERRRDRAEPSIGV